MQTARPDPERSDDLPSAPADGKAARDASLLRQAIESMPQGLCMFDADGRLLIRNSRYVSMYGMRPEDVRPGMPIGDILEARVAAGAMTQQAAQDYIGFARAAIGAARATSTYTGLVGGRTVAVEFRPLDGGGWVSTHEDITERVATEARLARLARQDPLTQLANHSELRGQLQRWLDDEPESGLSLLIVDLDRFKEVNDVLGRAGGDAVLRQVADRLRSVARGSDLVARTGGDSFAIACPQAGLAETGALAERVLRSLTAPFEHGEHELFIGASGGIGVASTRGRDASELMEQAAAALRRAKSDGRGSFCYFEPEMQARALTRRQLALDLGKALRRAEFEIVYQPIVDAASQELVSFEALLRWHHPARGCLTPADFIALAEETRLIEPVGEWVLRQACAQCAAWPAHIEVAVNVSAVQFQNPNLVATVTSALTAAGLSARRLVLEITESMPLLDDAATLDVLHKLRALGVRIAMDDFGTGYSALSYLPRFPFDKVKIDRCFLTGDDVSGRGGRMLEAIAAMAQTLNIDVTVEGVETTEQAARIRALGCTEMQGYMFGRPMPARETERLITTSAGVCDAA